MMTPEIKDKTIEEICEVLIEQGFSGLTEVLSWLLNRTMKMEREKALGAGPYERSPERKGQANGYKDRDLQLRMGSIPIRIPQARGMEFYPESIEQGLRSERALKVAVAQMYLQGVSTRKVKNITEELCGFSISSTQVSRVSQELDEQLQAWRSRPLGRYVYVYMDARYEKVRHGGCVKDLAVLWAYGVNEEGRREVLGVSVSLSEAEVHWREFFESLRARGLQGVLLFISDDHSGLKAARRAVFPGVAWQRCQFHLAQNALSYIPKQELKAEVTQDLRDIFNASTGEEAQEKLTKATTKYRDKAPRLSQWLEENLQEGFTVFTFPRDHQKKLRTSNGMERINQEIKRRTRVAMLFPNEESCLRLVSAILMEQNEEWVTGKIYLNMHVLKTHLLENENQFYRKNVA